MKPSMNKNSYIRLAGNLVLLVLSSLTLNTHAANTTLGHAQPVINAAAGTGPGLMEVDYRALVSRADVERPFPLGGAEAEHPGLPVGNGRLGTLLWQPAPAILALQLNHTDVFAFRASSHATRDAHQDYGNVCGRVEIGFGEDVFRPDTTHNHLGLYEALATVSGAGVRVRGLAWHAKDVLALEITDERAEPTPITVDLIMMRPAVQEAGPHKAISEVMAEGVDIELTQQFLEPKANPLVKDLASFTAVRARVLGREALAETRGDRVRLTVPAGQGSFVVLFALGQSMEEPLATVRAEAQTTLDASAALGFDKLLADNGVYWSDFWARSFISMTGTPELEEMTAFYLWGQYLSGICLRGNFPPKHSGLTLITKEQRRWGSLFWWYNESAQQGWQFEANRLELMMPVFRWNQIARPGYESAARQSWNSRGWYIPETSSWDGPELLAEGQYTPEGHRAGVHQSLRGTGWTARNTYNGAKFAALYYKYYQFTGDEDWLREMAYPALRDTAEFYCGLKAGFQYAGGIDYGEEGQVILRKEDDGKYHLYGTMLHEHIWWGRNIIEDLAAIRGIFPVAIAVSERLGVDADMRAEWQEVLDNLAPYPLSDQPGAIGSLGPGTWAQGLTPHGNIRGIMNEESPRLGPVVGDFLDVLTLESDNPDEWKVAMTTVEKHTGANASRYVGCGTYPVAVARMGRADMMERVLPLQMKSSGTPLGVSLSLQGIGVFSRAIHAALLLSVAPSPAEDAVIHVLPSWPRHWDVAFQLQAKGGFLVSASLKNEQLGFVEILSQLGGECRIRNPWPGREVEILRDGRRLARTEEDLLVIPTSKDSVHVLMPADAAASVRRRLAVPAPTLLEVALGNDRSAVSPGPRPHEALVLAYDTPGDASTALPLGNGQTGVSAWVEPNGDLVFFISRTDAWGPQSRLLKVGKVRVTMDPPLSTETTDLRQVLDMHEGVLEIESTVADQAAKIRLWVDAHHQTIHVGVGSAEPSGLRVAIEPWRTEARDLAGNERHYVEGATQAAAPRVWPDVVVQSPPGELASHVVWYHRNESSIYPGTLKHQGLDAFSGEDPLLHRTFGAALGGTGLARVSPTVLESEKRAQLHHIKIHPLTRQTPTPDAWLDALSAQVAADAALGAPTARLAAHRAWWRDFWQRSFIRIKGSTVEADAQEIANINTGYHANRYLVACGARGPFPVKFNGGIFNVGGYDKRSRSSGDPLDCPDYRRWGTPFWFQNQRHIYWPMLQAGDYDQVLPFFRMFRDALDLAKTRTETYFGHEGAYFAETAYFWGAYFSGDYGWSREGKSIDEVYNGYIKRYWQGGLELSAMMLAWHQHTGDDEVFRTLCLPVIHEVITFYDQHYKRDDDGKIHFYPAQILESVWDAENPMPEIAGLKHTLLNLLALPDRLTTSAQRAQWKRMQTELPPLPLTEVNGTPVLNCADKIHSGRSNHENGRLYAVWPYRLYGVNRPDYALALETWNHRPVKFAYHVCWHNDMLLAAMLGLSDQARTQLGNRYVMSESYRFPAMYVPGDFTPDHDNGGVCQNTIQSMLLQSVGDKIHLLPAWPVEWDVRFKLHAPNQTTVEAEVRDGRVVELIVTPESRRKDVTLQPVFELSKD